MEKITISKLGLMASVGVETIRFYQRKELLREPKKTETYRIYNEEDVQRIIFIKKAQDLGFTLKEVKELLELNIKPRNTCSTVKKKADQKISEIENKITALKNMRDSLAQLSCACDFGIDSVKQYKVQECFDSVAGCKPKILVE
jgi:MerR family mercuric resistance operon transcriptional regulator